MKIFALIILILSIPVCLLVIWAGMHLNREAKRMKSINLLTMDNTELIKYLNQQLENLGEQGTDLESCSFGHEEGILLTGNQVIQIVILLSENERLKTVLTKIKHGLKQLQDEAHNMQSADGLHGKDVEIRNNGIKSGARLALTMLELIEEKETGARVESQLSEKDKEIQKLRKALRKIADDIQRSEKGPDVGLDTIVDRIESLLKK